MNQLINQAPNLHYMTGGAARVPVVIRTRVGDGPYGGHPQDYSAWFAHVPGLKVVMPGHAGRREGADAGGDPRRQPGAVLRADVAGARRRASDVPAGDALVPIGTARIARAGTDVTVVAVGSTVPLALRAAAQLAEEGIEVEVVDLRSLRPWTARRSSPRSARPGGW